MSSTKLFPPTLELDANSVTATFDGVSVGLSGGTILVSISIISSVFYLLSEMR